MNIVTAIGKNSIIKVLLSTQATYVGDCCNPGSKAWYTFSLSLLPVTTWRCWASGAWEWLLEFSLFQTQLFCLQHLVDQLLKPEWISTLAFPFSGNATHV